VLLCSAVYYLLVQAKITEFLWSKYPVWLTHFLGCASCAGFWYGVVVSIIFGWGLHIPFLSLDGSSYYTPVIAGLCTMVTTPIIANLQIVGLLQTGVTNQSEQVNTQEN